MLSRFVVWARIGASFVAAMVLVVGMCLASGGGAASAATASGKPVAYGVISSDSGAAGTSTDTSTTVKDWVAYQ